MVRCPQCDGKTTVRDSRYKTLNNSIFRRRECLKCFNRFNTDEIVPDEKDKNSLIEMKIEIIDLKERIENINAENKNMVEELKQYKFNTPIVFERPKLRGRRNVE